MKNNNTKSAAAAKFLAAFLAFQANRDRSVHAKLNAALDTALAEYRKSHGLSEVNGLLDCINHYNRTYANA